MNKEKTKKKKKDLWNEIVSVKQLWSSHSRLIVFLIASSVVAVWGVSVFGITINFNPSQTESNIVRDEVVPVENLIIPSSEPTIVPTIKPVVKPQVQNVQQTNNQAQITHDGSRTGPIVDYYSYCDNKTIKVYENERVPFTTKDGKQIYSTQGDIDCYYKNLQNSNSPQKVATPQITQQTQENNTYCWSNAYGYSYYTSSGDQCNLNNAKATSYELCMSTQKMKNDSCWSACNTQLDESKTACAWAYTGSNPGIEQNPDKYGECLNGEGGASKQYGTCLEKCTDQHGQDNKQCHLEY